MSGIMKRSIVIGTTIFALLILLIALGPLVQEANSAAQRKDVIVFQGLFERPTTLTMEQLKELDVRYVSVTMIGHHVGYIGRFVYMGVPLKEAMVAAGYKGTRDPEVSAEDLIRVIGRDGYGMVLSQAEIFNQDSGMDIILAYEKDGNPLTDNEGPIRLVVPTDIYCGRYIKGVAKVEALTGYELPPKGD